MKRKPIRNMAITERFTAASRSLAIKQRKYKMKDDVFGIENERKITHLGESIAAAVAGMVTASGIDPLTGVSTAIVVLVKLMFTMVGKQDTLNMLRLVMKKVESQIDSDTKPQNVTPLRK